MRIFCTSSDGRVQGARVLPGAVGMARLVLLHGRDPLLRRLAEEIIAGQPVEIAAMQQRLTILRVDRDPDPGGFPALGGTRGPEAPGRPDPG